MLINARIYGRAWIIILCSSRSILRSPQSPAVPLIRQRVEGRGGQPDYHSRHAGPEGDSGRLAEYSRRAHLGLGLEVADLTQGEQRGNLHIRGSGTRLINLRLHKGVSGGIRCWDSAENAEIYGCVIHDYGMRGHRRAIYTQNREGTKRIVDNVDNIAFAGYG